MMSLKRRARQGEDKAQNLAPGTLPRHSRARTRRLPRPRHTAFEYERGEDEKGLAPGTPHASPMTGQRPAFTKTG